MNGDKVMLMEIFTFTVDTEIASIESISACFRSRSNRITSPCINKKLCSLKNDYEKTCVINISAAKDFHPAKDGCCST